MQPRTKKILLGLGLAIALFAIYGYNKAKKLIAVFDKMSIEPHRISKINVGFNRIKFSLDILLTNPTADDFEISGFGIAKLKSINVYYKDTYIATALVNLEEITTPANNQLIIHNIPVEVPKPIDFVANNLVLVYQMIDSFNVGDIKTTGILEVAGNDILIE